MCHAAKMPSGMFLIPLTRSSHFFNTCLKQTRNNMGLQRIAAMSKKILTHMRSVCATPVKHAGRTVSMTRSPNAGIIVSQLMIKDGLSRLFEALAIKNLGTGSSSSELHYGFVHVWGYRNLAWDELGLPLFQATPSPYSCGTCPVKFPCETCLCCSFPAFSSRASTRRSSSCSCLQ